MKLFLLCAAVAVAQEHLGSMVIEMYNTNDCTGPKEFLAMWEGLCIPYPSSSSVLARRSWSAGQVACTNPARALPGQQPSASIRLYASNGCSGAAVTELKSPSNPTLCASATLASSQFSFIITNITCSSFFPVIPVAPQIVQYDRPFQLATFTSGNCEGVPRRDLLNVNPSSSSACSWGGFRGERGANFTLPIGPLVSTGFLNVFPPVLPGGRGCGVSPTPSPVSVFVPPRTGQRPATNPIPTASCFSTTIPAADGIAANDVGSLRVEELPNYTPPGAGRINSPPLEPWQTALVIISVMLIVGSAVYFGNKWGYCVFKAAPMKAPMPPPGGARAKAPPMPGSLAPSSTGVGGGAAMKAPGQPQLALPAPLPSGGAGSRGGALPNPLNVINNSTPGVSEWANKRG